MIFNNKFDVSKDRTNKEKEYNYQLSKEKMNNFFNKTEYKTKLLNIDSFYRNKIPKNIYKSENIFLSNNPIQTTKNSNIISIYYPNHNFTINDNIIIQNVEGSTRTLINCLYFFVNYSYVFIQYNNHNIPLNYLDHIDNYKISIILLNNNNITTYGNIPINAIIGIHNIYLPSLIDNLYPILPEILSVFNVSNVSELDNNFILIELPFSYTQNSELYYVSSDVFKFNILNIGGIPLEYINADYPINYQRSQGYHQIINITNDYIYIQTSIISSYTINGGGDKIQIMLITNTIPGYPNANNYTIHLQHSFNNVVRIELLSTEIPFIDLLINSSGSKKNNKLYWKHYDDGNYIYQMDIPEGNYDSTNLISKITSIINTIPRIGSTNASPIYNIFDINLNIFTQEIKFYPYKNNNLPNSLSASLSIINNIKYVKITVYHPANLVVVADTILISGALKVGTIIDATLINTTQTIYEINITEQTYSFLIAPLNQITNATNIDLTGNGGPSTIIKTRAKVSFLFNYQDTLGNILGFKNVGFSNAITPYNTIVSNFDSYIQSTNLNEVGNIDLSNKILNLTGSDFYILMYINNFECIINNSNQPIAFAKIILSGSPGDILFNTFINYPLEFDFPVITLNQLTITFKYPDGSLVDFRNIDHSFTLRIMEEVKIPYNTNLNSKDISFIDTLKDET